MLEAVAKHELNDRAGAAVAIESALGLAERGNYRRAFVDGGPSVRGLLVERVRHGTDHRALVAELIAALERRAASKELTLPELLEPLSDREQAVLRYLPTMMSTRSRLRAVPLRQHRQNAPEGDLPQARGHTSPRRGRACTTGRAPLNSRVRGMRRVDGGTFAMGSEEFYPEERPIHRVSVDAFWIEGTR